ncbi:hypothetical protein Q9Q99_07090 [Curtobacterium flaccumfaciens]|nr:hypothetical protein Q9Q99_07090 [Curtobacterium flaccumfaciens]
MDSWRSAQGSSVGNPADIVSSIRTVGTGESGAGRATASKAGTKSVIGASRSSKPRATSVSRVAAVTLLVHEAMRYTVSASGR